MAIVMMNTQSIDGTYFQREACEDRLWLCTGVKDELELQVGSQNTERGGCGEEENGVTEVWVMSKVGEGR